MYKKRARINEHQSIKYNNGKQERKNLRKNEMFIKRFYLKMKVYKRI